MSLKTFAQSTALSAILATAGIIGWQSFSPTEGTLAQTQDAPIPREKLRHALGLADAFKEVSKAVSPSVVNIRSAQTLRPRARGSQENARPNTPEDFFRRFFEGPDAFDGQPMPDLGPRERLGQGSGVVIRDDGYILTNNHVVADADTITVTLADDRELTGTVLGTDPLTDLAVVKVEASNLTAARIGDSDAVEPGEWVLAIGSPFGLQHTVTAGIISAKGRQIGIIRDGNTAGYEDFIQTDAAINPGNSGGPLVNIYGEVIGINTAISTQTGGYMGVGFAIPSKMAQFVMNSIIEKGRVERGWLGVGIQPLTKDLAESYGLNSTEGALVNEVRTDSPAQKAGLAVDDVIVKFNSKPIATPTELMNLVASAAPGAKATVEVLREGKAKSFNIQLGERNPEVTARAGSRENVKTSENLGLSVRPLTPDAARQLNAENVDGVLIAEVDPDSPAGRIGLEPGDIISKIGDRAIASVDDFTEAMGEADINKGVRLHVVRDGLPRVIVMKSAR